MVFSIDLDRGVHMRAHPSLGMDIYMYVGRPRDPSKPESDWVGADPGIYFDAHGNEVSNVLAEQAGFDVESHTKQHKIKVALEEAGKEVLVRFGETKNEVVKERAGFKIKDIGVGRHNVEDPDGNVLNGRQPLTLDQANILLSHLAPVMKEEEEAKKAEKKK